MQMLSYSKWLKEQETAAQSAKAAKNASKTVTNVSLCHPTVSLQLLQDGHEIQAPNYTTHGPDDLGTEILRQVPYSAVFRGKNGLLQAHGIRPKIGWNMQFKQMLHSTTLVGSFNHLHHFQTPLLL